MWFKQAQFFQLTDYTNFTLEKWQENLEALAFRPCFPSMPVSAGWVSPLEDISASYFRIINDCVMLCVQFEEKILPATVIRQELSEKIKYIQLMENRKVYQKEKIALKEELTMTLLPRAFSRFSRVYGYVDIKNQWLVLGTANPKKNRTIYIII